MEECSVHHNAGFRYAYGNRNWNLLEIRFEECERLNDLWHPLERYRPDWVSFPTRDP